MGDAFADKIGWYCLSFMTIHVLISSSTVFSVLDKGAKFVEAA
jgi:hypothetical protein